MSEIAHDSSAKLLTMAGQIADFYKSSGATAPEAIAGHINKFWTPKMREDFLAAASDRTLEPPALEAAKGLVRRRKAEAF
ncbi:formate dehydrogenase subunit delta [Rhodoblastus acidophilus]|uniref:formate dehydrogenase subunit delta n=1 Tax=Rhodoblastus acidophilus TaxID=1074 RepID=UPI0022243BEA|nr:formate dehydrogenase subunit delta [Rhodoblastus acidophilus]MCW2317399.1 formate dehydrogenase subunit delta [Rhodoblastus acidophilus]